MKITDRRSLLCGVVAGLLAGALPATAQQPFPIPGQPIKIIVGYAPGGNVDIPARLFAPELQRILGVPIIIENHPGASGVPAADMVKRAKPDGHTLVWGTSASHSVSVIALAPLQFDPVKDFTPITLISEDGNVIISSKEFPANNIQELIAYLKANPKTPIGTSGPATSGRFAVELMKPKLGLDLTIVPYQSAGPMLTALSGNHIPLGIMGASTAVPFVKDGSIKAFAVTSLQKSTVLPELPTLDATVSKGFEAVAWSALYAPPGTPRPVVDKILAAMREVAQVPAVKKWMDTSGLYVPMSSPEELTKFMREDIDKWVQTAKDNNIKIEPQ